MKTETLITPTDAVPSNTQPEVAPRERRSHKKKGTATVSTVLTIMALSGNMVAFSEPPDIAVHRINGNGFIRETASGMVDRLFNKTDDLQKVITKDPWGHERISKLWPVGTQFFVFTEGEYGPECWKLSDVDPEAKSWNLTQINPRRKRWSDGDYIIMKV